MSSIIFYKYGQAAVFTLACLLFNLSFSNRVAASEPSRAAETPIPDEAFGDSQTISFKWRPKIGSSAAYRMDAVEDQHRIILFDGAAKNTSPIVLIGFHGQPARNKNPGDYMFPGPVEAVVRKMISDKVIPPVILVLPVFRFVGQNWPGFDLVEFKKKIEEILSDRKIIPKRWLLFGHSGAAGCGGDGLNQAAQISPEAVGFFDTCLGAGWQDAVKALRAAKVPTVNLHSVETAGFRPRQHPEYKSNFDFGRAYAPLGLRPVKCPSLLPEAPLRDQPYRCAATPDGIVEAYVVNTGEGQEAHIRLLPEALSYFLRRFLSR